MPPARMAQIGAAVLALALPLLLRGSYHRHILVLAGLFILMALGFDLVLGYIGELSLGHAAFFGIGAYTTALLTRHFDVPFPADLLLAGLCTGVAGVVIGAPSLRLKGPYFAIVTFGFAEILRLVALNWTSVTRGPMGLPDIPHPQLGPFRVTSELGYYYIILALIGVAILVTLLAIRENDELASATGISTFRFKLIVFVIGMIFTGAAGSVYARYVHFVDPTALSFYYTVTVVSIVIVGGQGSITGTILGALIVSLLPEYLRVVESARLVIFGALLMAAIVFMPEGLRGLVRPTRQRGRQRVAA
jgi:branched-chain amino acid transport system permease protein